MEKRARICRRVQQDHRNESDDQSQCRHSILRRLFKCQIHKLLPYLCRASPLNLDVSSSPRAHFAYFDQISSYKYSPLPCKPLPFPRMPCALACTLQPYISHVYCAYLLSTKRVGHLGWAISADPPKPRGLTSAADLQLHYSPDAILVAGFQFSVFSIPIQILRSAHCFT